MRRLGIFFVCVLGAAGLVACTPPGGGGGPTPCTTYTQARLTAGNADSQHISVDDSGDYIVFSSMASDLVPPPPPGDQATYLLNRVANTTTQLGTGFDFFAAISGDWTKVVEYRSSGSGTVATDIAIYDVASSTATPWTPPAGVQPYAPIVISGNGGTISWAGVIDPGGADTPGLFVTALGSNTTTQIASPPALTLTPVDLSDDGNRVLVNHAEGPTIDIIDVAGSSTYTVSTDTFISGLDLSDDGTTALAVSSDTVNGSGTYLWTPAPFAYTQLSIDLLSGGRISGDKAEVMVTDLFAVSKIKVSDLSVSPIVPTGFVYNPAAAASSNLRKVIFTSAQDTPGTDGNAGGTDVFVTTC